MACHPEVAAHPLNQQRDPRLESSSESGSLCNTRHQDAGFRAGQEMVAIKVRCLDDVDIAALKLMPFDGKHL
jgi:hypothetical protein